MKEMTKYIPYKIRKPTSQTEQMTTYFPKKQSQGRHQDFSVQMFFLSYCNVKPRVQSQCVSFSILHQEYVIMENISAATIKYFVRYLKYCIVLKISIRNFHFVYACNEKHERTTCNKHPFVCQAIFTTLDCSNCRIHNK